MTRVLFIGDHLGYEGGVLHGGTVYAINVFPQLAGAGVEIACVFLGTPHPAADTLRNAGIATSFLGLSRWNPLGLMQLLRLARQWRPSVIHLSGQKASLLGRLVARALRVPAIVHVHDFVPVPWGVRAAFAIASSRRDLAMAVSDSVAAELPARYRIAAANVRVLWNGLPLRWFDLNNDAGKRLPDADVSALEGQQVILVVGRFFAVKGQKRLIDLSPPLLAEHPDASLWFAGDGPLLEDCRLRVRELGLEGRVRFLGQRNDVRELMRAAAVIAIPSDSEGLSTAAIESAAVGRAVVAFDCGGTREVILEGVTGLLVRPGDDAGFRAALDRVLRDASLRERMANAAMASAHRFSLQEHVRRLTEIYRQASGEPERAS